ncbi:DUF4839 domain-containing protein [Actinoplanes sp. CA-252034]|uniref:DUF4839 domain-containing protein n=1 Tax=Actinoplanes sp. CA-252034 TaxID=3239906 RepID=UPI003D9773A9
MVDEIRYEYTTVRAIRGTDSSMIAKMQKDGWEFVDQTPGMLRSTLNFRRPKKPVLWRLIGVGVAVLAVLAVAGGIASALSDGGEKGEGETKAEAATTAAATTAPVVSEQPAAAPTPTAVESPATKVITARNNPEFAALLKADSCDDANVDFATKYAGRTVAFNGSIVHMAPHGDYDTRYDFLLGPGDKGPRTTVGPAFHYEDVNVFDLNLTGKKIPAIVGAGDKFRFVAEVREFNTVQCSFYLDPVSTEVR